VGAGFSYHGYFALGKQATNFKAEIMCIYEAAFHLSSLDLNKTAALLCRQYTHSTRPSKYSAANKVNRVISQSHRVGEVFFQWIPWLCGIPGNDMVSTLAKDALNLPRADHIPTSSCRNYKK
jgi:ribonuclease HI